MDSPNDTPLKTCSKCKQPFPSTPEYFRRDKHNPDGLYLQCKPCSRQKPTTSRRRRRKEVLPDGFRRCLECEEVKANEAFSWLLRGRYDSYCKACRAIISMVTYEPSQRVCLSPEQKRNLKHKRDKLYSEAHQEEHQAYQKQYYIDNADHKRQYSKDWALANPVRVSINNKVRKARRRALEAQADGSHTREDELLQLKSQKGLCWWCGKKLTKWHADHLIPLARGGSNWPNNIVASCPRCNLSRRHKLPQEWNGRLF